MLVSPVESWAPEVQVDQLLASSASWHCQGERVFGLGVQPRDERLHGDAPEGEVVSESGTLRHLSSQQSVGIANITIILGFQLFFDTYSVGINLAMAFLVALSVCLSPAFSCLAVVGAND